ncbi:ABC transporter substrate-binding protein [Actinomadura kijaniata]|uniref:Peptide/nickel transport system substrate-binding protein n=1 Tax=Actinomadura namibiensis TaxID=182080 RepID=A0A7W3LMR9_ACTNM|nr:ABC transporter substrate-binding protein [Actinomadura namibiensis]MBA8951008.1 peptide/nickel transport system substrate-binding protein [Actinomadura namibiensis]
MRKSVLVVGSIAMATGLLATACGGSGSGSAGGTSGGTFTYAIGDEPETLNPALQDEHTDPVTEMVFRGLTRHDANNKVVPGLAESWRVAENGTEYTFKLRPGLTWHDGKPLTSKDVKFTIDTVKAAGADAPLSRNFSAVRSVETPDDTTATFTLSRPFAPLLDAVSMGLLPAHALTGKKITDGGFGQAPVGAGPFRLKAFKPGQYAELEAFDRYYEGRPRLPKIVIKYVPDDSARLIQLRNGEVDGAHIQPQQVARAKSDDRVRLETYPTADYRALLFNFKNPVFADKRVRQAMNFAVDRDAVVRSVLAGQGKPATGPLDTNPFKSGPAPFRHDPARADELMKGAGYARNAQGLWEKDGKTVRFELTTFAEDSARVAILNVAATQLRQAGFDISGTPKPRSWVRDHWGDLGAFVIGWGTPYDADSSVFGPFHSSEELDKGGSNYGSYKNAEVDRALERGRGTLDEGGRRAAYADFQKALAEDPPFVWIAYLDTNNAVPRSLTGPQRRTLGHHGYGFFWNVEKWAWS